MHETLALPLRMEYTPRIENRSTAVVPRGES